jgi:hypothetical protein
VHFHAIGTVLCFISVDNVGNHMTLQGPGDQPARCGAPSNARICVVSGTTTEENAADYFERNGIDVTFLRFTDRSDARNAYESGECDVCRASNNRRAAAPAPLVHPT